MATNCMQLLSHAMSLPEDSEVEIRVKISRLYYALYSHACEFQESLSEKGHLLKKDVGAHKKLSQQLTNPTVEDTQLQDQSRQLGTQQMLAHELRLQADYDLHLDVRKRDLQKCLMFVQKGIAIPLPQKAAA